MHPQYPQQPQQGPYPPPAFGYPAQPGYPGAPWPPAQPPKPRWGKVVAATVAGALALGGGAFAAHQHLRSSDAAACSVEGARNVEVDSRYRSEPIVTVPLRSGWDRMEPGDVPNAPEGAESPSIRGLFVNTGIRDNGFAPNIVVTLDRSSAASGQEANDKAIADARASVGSVKDQSSSVACGNTLYRTDFADVPGPDGKTQTGTWFIAVAESPDGDMWLACATIQTRNPNDPEYIAARDALLEGFQIQFPKS